MQETKHFLLDYTPLLVFTIDTWKNLTSLVLFRVDQWYVCIDVCLFSIAAGCVEGQFFNGQLCVSCPVGTYQDEKYQTSCKLCNTGLTTVLMGAPSDQFCRGKVYKVKWVFKTQKRD